MASEPDASFGLPTEGSQVPFRAERTFNTLRSEASKPSNEVKIAKRVGVTCSVSRFVWCLFGLLIVWIGFSEGRRPALGASNERTLRIPLRVID
ncbi:MAG: hypothetical protein ACTS6H_01065 [Candidatus Hodgkinia cicadicola]